MSPRVRGRTGRARYGCATLLLAVVVIVLLTGAMRTFWTRVDQRRFPWAYEETGRPTLTGSWVGTLTTALGTRRAMYLVLELRPLDFDFGSGRHRRRGNVFRRAQSDKLVGELRMCGGPALQRFTLHGNELADDASRFRLSFAVADSVPPDGLAPSHLRGAWNRRDSLRIEADVYLRRGASAITDSADPETGRPQQGALHRAGESEFRALCGRLVGGT